MLVHTHS